MLDDLHEVRKYNLRKRNTSTDTEEAATEPSSTSLAPDSKNNQYPEDTFQRTGRKPTKKGNKRGTASKRAQNAKAFKESKVKRRKLESPTPRSNTPVTNQPLILPLESLLDDFFKQESLDVYCQKCYEEMKVSIFWP